MEETDIYDKTPVTLPDVNSLISRLPLTKCWAGSFYLGSMFVLDFGGRLVLNRKSRGPVEVGESSISIRNVYWKLQAVGRELTTAEAVNADLFSATVRPALMGSSLCRVEMLTDQSCIAFQFSNSVDLIVDTTNKWESDDMLAEITLQNGRFLQLMPGGDWVTPEDWDPVRRQAFESINSNP